MLRFDSASIASRASFAALNHYRRLQPLHRSFFFQAPSIPQDDDGANSPSGASVTKLGIGDSAPRYPHVAGLPIQSRPIFPLLPTAVIIKDPATIAALEQQLTSGNSAYLATFLRKADAPQGSFPEVIADALEIYETGTFCQVHRMTRLFDNQETQEEGASPVSLWLIGHRRVDLQSVDNVGPPMDVTVRHWDRREVVIDENLRALSNELVSTLREVAQRNALFRESLQYQFPAHWDPNDPLRLADYCASLSKSASAAELQAVLEEAEPEARLHKALVLLNKEREVAKLQEEISKKVEADLTDQQRKYFLKQQLQSIKKELGMEQDDKDALIEKYREQTASWPQVPEEIMETIEQELGKLETLEKNSSEFNVTRSYLDWLCGLPWGHTTEELFDLAQARRVLDKDHYGLDTVKDTILEFIAVGKLKQSVQGQILCLSGPPGVGKTSIAKSVAEALGRKFYRFSVGGLSDVSELKGHRRTYIGAMPGKIIQCLKSSGSMNPLVLIDEIDKLGAGYRGDPASAFLEILDPSQNSNFRDHYLDVPVDISKVLFMCTANDLDRIPGPLLDRMEVIRLTGYDFPEKVAIAEQYLVPKSLGESGLMFKKEPTEDGRDKDLSPLALYQHAENVPSSLSIDKSAIESLVRWYAREAGVRNLAKLIDKITRKLALQVVAEQEGTKLTEKTARKHDTWRITDENLSDYVGKPIFISDRLYEKDPLPVGIVMGLAYTSLGGSALYIETQAIKRAKDPDGKPRGGGNIKVTGQLGDVMKESSSIAYTVARARLQELDPKNTFFDDSDIHLHVPEGATPKDGPSAGCTMVTAMLSLAIDKPVRSDVAMTGEVSLTGKVLPVGGIKEKTMAARRAGITCLILPAANERDWDEIASYLKEGLEVHFADDYETVRKVAFG